MKFYKRIIFVVFILQLITSNAFAKLGNNINENRRQYGRELQTKAFSKEDRHFSGKKTYLFPLYGWQIEAIYSDGESFSETARPKGKEIKRGLIKESEANVIADMLYPKKDRGPYRKQIKNANFVSHFFEHGVVSYEMQLDKRRKDHIGIVGVRTIRYNNGDRFKDIKVNAYQ